LQKSDTDHSGDIGFSEFIEYVREHEKKLRLQFKQMDKNSDGKH
jgi:Ca2+-binding EF-hand superfamily protein